MQDSEPARPIDAGLLQIFEGQVTCGPESVFVSAIGALSTIIYYYYSSDESA